MPSYRKSWHSGDIKDLTMDKKLKLLVQNSTKAHSTSSKIIILTESLQNLEGGDKNAIEQSLIKVNYSQPIKDRFKVLVPQLSIF